MDQGKIDYGKELGNCPLVYTLKIAGGKWKFLIIYLLYSKEVLRYGQLKKLLKGITHKVLSEQLKELINDEMVSRKEYDLVPPQVEYRLTARGQSVLPVLKAMYDWGKNNKHE